MPVTFITGVVVDNPISDTDQIRVSSPNLTQQDRKTYGPFSFRPHVSGFGEIRFPSPGDPAIIGTDSETGDQWIVDWTGSRVVFTIGAGIGVSLDIWHRVGAPGEAPFQNSWNHYDGSAGPWPNGAVGYKKGVEGKVKLQGMPRGGSLSLPIFTLPAGYRPTTTHRFAVMGFNGATAAYVAAYISILTTGVVEVETPFMTADANTWVDLSVIEFDTETVLAAQSSIATPIDPIHYVGSGGGEPGFQNAWVNHGQAGYAVAQFRKFPDGRVQIKGMVKDGTVGAAAFTLPAGYRPPGSLEFGQSSAGSFGRLLIQNDGQVIPNTGSNASFFLTCEFDTETVTGYAAGQFGGGTALGLAIAGTDRKIAFGQSPAFSWSGGIHTLVAVTHGLGVVPQVIIPSQGRYGDAVGDDARAPWLTTTGAKTTSTFDLLFNTKNNAAIGVFAVPAGACDWIAIG